MPRLLRSSNDWDKSGDAPDRLDRRYFRGFGRALPDRPRLAAIRARSGEVPLRLSEPGFHSLASIIVSQQVSTASARAIFGRFTGLVDPLTPQALLAAGGRFVSRRPACRGRSRRRCLRSLEPCSAASISTRCAGSIRTRRWRAWSPFPASGHGRRKSTCCLPPAIPTFFRRATSPCRLRWAMRLAMEARPGEKALIAIAESWRPWRGVASRLFWAYYRTIKGRDAVPTA